MLDWMMNDTIKVKAKLQLEDRRLVILPGLRLSRCFVLSGITLRKLFSSVSGSPVVLTKYVYAFCAGFIPTSRSLLYELLFYFL